MTPLLLDTCNRAIQVGDSAYVHEWSPTAPLLGPYLWQVVYRVGTLALQSRPDGRVQALTPALGRALCVFDEPAFARPELHAASWQQLRELGWVAHAEQVKRKAEYVFRAQWVVAIPGQADNLGRELAANGPKRGIPGGLALEAPSERRAGCPLGYWSAAGIARVPQWSVVVASQALVRSMQRGYPSARPPVVRRSSLTVGARSAQGLGKELQGRC